jgi:hypothetical protein
VPQRARGIAGIDNGASKGADRCTIVVCVDIQAWLPMINVSNSDWAWVGLLGCVFERLKKHMQNDRSALRSYHTTVRMKFAMAEKQVAEQPKGARPIRMRLGCCG